MSNLNTLKKLCNEIGMRIIEDPLGKLREDTIACMFSLNTIIYTKGLTEKNHKHRYKPLK